MISISEKIPIVSIEPIDLHNTRLKSLLKKIFSGLTNVHRINLDHDQLNGECLEEYLEGFISFKSVVLYSNQQNSLPVRGLFYFDRFSSLERISLNNDCLTEYIPKENLKTFSSFQWSVFYNEKESYQDSYPTEILAGLSFHQKWTVVFFPSTYVYLSEEKE